MELSHPNVIFKQRVLGLAQTPAKHSETKGALRNKCPAQMEKLWGNLAVVLHGCNQLNGSPAPACQQPRESLYKIGRTWQDGAVGSSSCHLLHPGALAQAAPVKSIGGQQTLCSHGTAFPKLSLPHSVPALRESPMHAAPFGRSAWTLQAQGKEDGPPKSGRGWPVQPSNPARGAQHVPEPTSRAGRALERQTHTANFRF